MKNKILKNCLYFLIIAGLISAGCATLQIKPVGEIKKLKRGGIFYSLPQTGFNVEILLNKKILVPGPFYAYAEKYLGIKNVQDASQEKWEIADVKIIPFYEPDTSAQYFLSARCSHSFPEISLSRENILTGIGKSSCLPDIFSAREIHNNTGEPDTTLLFKDQTNKKIYFEDIDTTYKTVRIDSTYIKVPVYKRDTVVKDMEHRAEDAANHILRLRKREFKLLSGAYDKMPDGTAVSAIIEELKKEEEEYLSLFIGKSVTVNHRIVYEVVPVSSESRMQFTLCWFSQEKGLLSENTSGSIPIVLEIIASGMTDRIDTLLSHQKCGKSKNGLYYRVPEQAQVKILKGDALLMTSRILVAQYGITYFLPARLLKKRDFSLDMYPETGGTKNIR
jgi:hypothetical protein